MDQPAKRFGRLSLAWAGAGPVLLVVALFTARMLLRMNADGGLTPAAAIAIVSVIAVITLGGMGFGWMRLEAARKERRNRPKPLDMN